MKIAEELRADGSTRYRVQHKDIARPGRYTTRRFDDKRDAQEFVRRAKLELSSAIAWDEERKGGVSFRGQAGRTFLAYATDYVNSRTESVARTREQIASDLRTIARVESFVQLQMGAITSADLKNLKRELSALRQKNGDPYKAATKNNYLVSVFAVIRHAVVVRDIPRDVTLGISKFRVDDSKEPCPVTIEEFDSIMVHVAPARRGLFRLLLDSGMRISEALALEWDDLRDIGQGIYEVFVRDGKTESSRGRITTIPVETFKMLAHDDETRVFAMNYDTASREWRNAVRRAQSPVFATEFPVLMKTPTPHDLRHTHAGFLITKCGMNLAIVAERLGHRDIGITQRYYGRLVKGQAHDLGVVVARNIPRGVVVS
jgi:integrase